jgi:hypothetical protein
MFGQRKRDKIAILYCRVEGMHAFSAVNDRLLVSGESKRPQNGLERSFISPNEGKVEPLGVVLNQVGLGLMLD